MGRIFGQDWFNGFIITILLIAIAVVVVGAILYLVAGRELSTNIAFQLQNSEEQVEVQDEAQAQGLVAAGIERDRLVQQQNTSLIVGGIGLVIAGIAWLLFDYGRNYRKRKRADAD